MLGGVRLVYKLPGFSPALISDTGNPLYEEREKEKEKGGGVQQVKECTYY